MERNTQLLNKAGWTGAVVPSAFHANEGASGVRRLYLREMAIQSYFCFENRRLLFEIHRSFKFGLVIARRPGPSAVFPCAFYLHDDEWLFGDRASRLPLSFSLEFVTRIGGDYLNFPEIVNEADFSLLSAIASACELSFGSSLKTSNIALRMTELHTSHDAHRFERADQWAASPGTDLREPNELSRLVARSALLLQEGKYFHQFTDRWGEPPRYVVPLGELADKPDVIRPSKFFRIALRKIARSTDQRTAIMACLPPGVVFADNTISEKAPGSRPTCVAMLYLSLVNTYVFDWLLRQRVASTVNVFFVEQVAAPFLRPARPLLTHLSTRLTCNHGGYAILWKEQLGDAWREPDKKPLTWPVLSEDDDRWPVRAAIDAVVAEAYGLSREQYAHVLSTFSHASYKKASELCLACFDELKRIGLEAFTKKHDPYWDIPLNENRPMPVIDLPIPDDPQVPLFANQEEAKPKKRTRKKAQG
jgi:hypothetical protein